MDEEKPKIINYKEETPLDFKETIPIFLKQIHSHLSISEKSIEKVASYLYFILKLLLDYSLNLVEIKNQNILKKMEIEISIIEVFKGAIASFSLAEGNKAVTKYNSKYNFQKKNDDKNSSPTIIKCGLTFSVENVKRIMIEDFNIKKEFEIEVCVFLTSVIEYFSAEILEISGNITKVHQMNEIKVNHVESSIKSDEELNYLFCGGKTPAIFGVSFDPQSLYRKLDSISNIGNEPFNFGLNNNLNTTNNKESSSNLGNNLFNFGFDKNLNLGHSNFGASPNVENANNNNFFNFGLPSNIENANNNNNNLFNFDESPNVENDNNNNLFNFGLPSNIENANNNQFSFGSNVENANNNNQFNFGVSPNEPSTFIINSNNIVNELEKKANFEKVEVINKKKKNKDEKKASLKACDLVYSKNYKDFNVTLPFVLKKIHPHLSVSKKVLEKIEYYLNFVLKNILDYSLNLIEKKSQDIITTEEIGKSCIAFLKGELGKFSVSEGEGVVNIYKLKKQDHNIRYDNNNNNLLENAKIELGLIHCVENVKKIIIENLNIKKFEYEVCIYLTSVIEYISADILELAADALLLQFAYNDKINVSHVEQAIVADEEFNYVFNGGKPSTLIF